MGAALVKYEAHWGSHIPPLLRAFALTDGPVLELGMGVFSTTFLHWICLDAGRRLLSCENDPTFFAQHASFASEDHQLYLVDGDTWDAAPIDEEFWSVALVDHGPPERRTVEALRLARNCEFILVHDSQWKQNHHYLYRELLFPFFKYRYDYTKHRVHTTVLSDITDLSDFYPEGVSLCAAL